MEEILGPIVLISVLFVPVPEVFRRILVDIKYKKIFPGRSIKRDSMLFNVDLGSIPSDDKGQEFIAYFRRTSRLNLIPVLSVFCLTLVLAVIRK